MTMYDLLIRGDTLITVDSPFEAVADGRTAAIAPDRPRGCGEEGSGRPRASRLPRWHRRPCPLQRAGHDTAWDNRFPRSQGRLGTGQPTPDATQSAGMAEAVETVENR